MRPLSSSPASKSQKENLHTIKSTTSESPVSGDTESEANLNCTIALMGCGYRLIVSRWYFYPHCSALMFSQEFKDWHWGIDFQQNTWQRLVGSYWFYGQTQMKNWCPWYAKKISRLVRLRAHLLRDVLSRFWPKCARFFHREIFTGIPWNFQSYSSLKLEFVCSPISPLLFWSCWQAL